jgi:hypothetical protein
MALALKDRVKETTIVVGTGAATLLGSSIGFQPFSVVGNGNTTYYCISDQFGSNWEVGIGTYSSSGNTLARTTVLASSNSGALVTFTAGIKDVFVTYPAEKGVWLDGSGNAIGLGTPAAFVGTNITGTASGLTAGNVTTNANLSGAVSSIGNSTSLGSFTSAQLALAISDETGTGKAVFATNPTLTSPTYAGTLTGSTDILNIGSGQIYKDASGNVGIGTSSPNGKFEVYGADDTVTYLRNATAAFRFRPYITSVGFSQIAAMNGALSTYAQLNIGGSVTVLESGGTERMRIGSSGTPMFNCTTQIIRGDETFRAQLNAGIASFITSTGNYPVIALKNTGTNGYMMGFSNASTEIGTISSNGSNVAYNTSSDYRLKENVSPMTNALDKIQLLKPCTFTWKSDGSNSQGFIAHELQEIVPDCVTGEKDAVDAEGKPVYQGIDTSFLVATLTAAIKEQQTLIEALTARLTKAGI